MEKGHTLEAAAAYLSLVDRGRLDELSSRVLYDASFALHKANDQQQVERIWPLLRAKVRQCGLRVNDRDLSVQELSSILSVRRD